MDAWASWVMLSRATSEMASANMALINATVADGMARAALQKGRRSIDALDSLVEVAEVRYLSLLDAKKRAQLAQDELERVLTRFIDAAFDDDAIPLSAGATAERQPGSEDGTAHPRTG
jgi:hypothetical protein